MQSMDDHPGLRKLQPNVSMYYFSLAESGSATCNALSDAI